MPEEQAPEAFGSQPCVLIFSLFPYSRFWGCRMIEPVYPDDTREVTKRSHQLARATSAVPWEAFSPAGSYLPEKMQWEVKHWPFCQAHTVSVSEPSLQGTKLKSYLPCQLLRMGWEDLSSQQWPVSSLERTKIFFPKGLNCRWLRLGWNLSWSHPNL